MFVENDKSLGQSYQNSLGTVFNVFIFFKEGIAKV